MMPLTKKFIRLSWSAFFTVLAASGIGCGTQIGGSSAYHVELVWDPPESSSDPVAGYNVYRSAHGSDLYTALTSTGPTVLTYTDTAVVEGRTYDYIVESVDAHGNLSAPSNTYTAAIP